MSAEVSVTDESGERHVGFIDFDTAETHGGSQYARVWVPSLTRTAWVEVPETPKTPDNVLVCEDCGREETVEDDEEGDLRKENVCNHLGSALALRDAHEAKRPTHSPQIEIRA
jgi:hypothetical protein